MGVVLWGFFWSQFFFFALRRSEKNLSRQLIFFLPKEVIFRHKMFLDNFFLPCQRHQTCWQKIFSQVPLLDSCVTTVGGIGWINSSREPICKFRFCLNVRHVWSVLFMVGFTSWILIDLNLSHNLRMLMSSLVEPFPEQQ